MHLLNHQNLCSDSSNLIQDMAGSYSQTEVDYLNIEIIAALLSL